QRSTVRSRIRRAWLPIDERHLSKEVSALENRERFLPAAGDEFGDPGFAVGDDVHLVAGVAFLEDEAAAGEFLFLGEGGEGFELFAGEALFAEEADFVVR